MKPAPDPMTAPGRPGASARARRSFWAVAVVLGLFLAAASAPSPLYATYATYAARWHFGPATITVIFAVYAIALLAVLLTAGSLSDSRGRRPVIIAALPPCSSTAPTPAPPTWDLTARPRTDCGSPVS